MTTTFPKLAFAVSFIACVISSDSTAYAQTTDDEPADGMIQESETIVDEVIVDGKRTGSSHKGLDAFYRGDYVTAEIEFEREFKSLRRGRSALDNAAFSADIAADNAAAIGQVGAASPGGSNNGNASGGFGNTSNGLSSSASLSTTFLNRRSENRTVLDDGKITFDDFAMTRYMAGLSEIKLGKYDEALTSMKSSLTYDKGNYDARMRLGMLYLMQRDYDRAADQLETLDKMRRRCDKIACDEQQAIRDAAFTLAQEITKSIESMNMTNSLPDG